MLGFLISSMIAISIYRIIIINNNPIDICIYNKNTSDILASLKNGGYYTGQTKNISSLTPLLGSMSDQSENTHIIVNGCIMEGNGMITYSDNSTFVGSFLSNMKHGEGVLTYNINNKNIKSRFFIKSIKGTYLFDKKNGLFELILLNNSIFKTYFKNDNIVINSDMHDKQTFDGWSPEELIYSGNGNRRNPNK